MRPLWGAWIALLLHGCSLEQPHLHPNIVADLQPLKTHQNRPVVPIPVAVDDNPALTRIGLALFMDPRLSSNGKVSCATCHPLNQYGAQPSALSPGVAGSGPRNSPTVFNTSLNPSQFWDGRAHSLETQIDGPLHNPLEMDSDWPAVVARLSNDAAFHDAFIDASGQPLSEHSIKAAISHFERQLLTPGSRFDRYLQGELTLTASESAGWSQFQSLGCILCHQGVNLGGNLQQTFGLTQRPASTSVDRGLGDNSGDKRDAHVFRVPGLRNVAQTAPYFHDGSVTHLDQAIEIMAMSQLGITLTANQTHDIGAFLHSLTAPPPAILREAP
ncbi:cytochrome-c peroxidase [Ferrimonas sp. SCSIO 43195]|uniref:cytochrome-c peroxidase n=1 Tax=Ferrimonas sp. SCSIO 43195 TaxID=2822844 RepID=UPI0020764DF1|nr:cytochrome c peroxidase [Ferrimonas sp. SCSIO 43195]USD37074.1 cytochrome-c peroxidase [Ferrimonas sp. SCSIO 43195]